MCVLGGGGACLLGGSTGGRLDQQKLLFLVAGEEGTGESLQGRICVCGRGLGLGHVYVCGAGGMWYGVRLDQQTLLFLGAGEAGTGKGNYSREYHRGTCTPHTLPEASLCFSSQPAHS